MEEVKGNSERFLCEIHGHAGKALCNMHNNARLFWGAPPKHHTNHTRALAPTNYRKTFNPGSALSSVIGTCSVHVNPGRARPGSQ
jgi:hypothetical protein